MTKDLWFMATIIKDFSLSSYQGLSDLRNPGIMFNNVQHHHFYIDRKNTFRKKMLCFLKKKKCWDKKCFWKWSWSEDDKGDKKCVCFLIKRNDCLHTSSQILAIWNMKKKTMQWYHLLADYSTNEKRFLRGIATNFEQLDLSNFTFFFVIWYRNQFVLIIFFYYT